MTTDQEDKKRRGQRIYAKRVVNVPYVKRTISLPPDLWPYAQEQASQPAFAGNLSAWLRWLIAEHMEKSLEVKK